MTCNEPRCMLQILGVEPDSTLDEIRQNFLRLALQYHPDKTCSSNANATQYVQIQQAWEVLRDPERRMLYDRESQNGT